MVLRTLRTRVVPWALWGATMAGVTLLWQDVHGEAALGFALVAEVELSAPEPTRIVTIAAELGQRVRAGDTLVALDVRALDAELAVIAAERERLTAELGAVHAESQVQVSDATRQFDESVAAAELALKTARGERKVHAAELAAMSAQVETLAGLVEQRMADRRELDARKVELAALEKQLETADALIQQFVSQAAAARARRATLPVDATEAAIRPVRAEMAVLDRQEQLLTVRREAMTLRAPVDGEVAALHLQAGEFAAAGAPIITLVGPSGRDEIRVCQPEQQAGRTRVGEAVRVSLRGGDGRSVAGRVTHVAPRVAELPQRCWRDPRRPEWGSELIVRLDEEVGLLAGQAFEVRALGRAAAPLVASTPTDELPPPTSADEPQPGVRPLVVPFELAARTRFEPSALTWSPRLDRFVIVSDDTGRSGDARMPWLFTMDRSGRVDPEPLVPAGISAFSDLEAIATSGDCLYVLASQSRNRKGKRPASRQVFARVSLTKGVKVEASMSLAEELERHSATTEALGLSDLADLDIEGMTATAAGGLLLGLKAPLDADGRAPVWHLPRPDDLLAGASPSAAGLSSLGSVSLEVRADGQPRPGGISELLELPDGSLLIATTASGIDPTQQDGGLWRAPSRGDLARAHMVRSFPGLKPEGLALRPDGAAVVIMFDTGDAAPRWMELPWPAP